MFNLLATMFVCALAATISYAAEEPKLKMTTLIPAEIPTRTSWPLDKTWRPGEFELQK
ncbi:hypothetical protein [Zwartia sp.]|uniref:hypothetical protein n=1 Tax=Zwartia sp. TaxID=2978004 RepID=UPI0027167BFC|nr:hypothetical protein [Zwartia sp.]MDO9024295.1 hypothetical protein [Zwartia sp.]